MKWCCDSFQHQHGQRHERGIFVYALPPVRGVSDVPSFHFGARVIRGTSVSTVTTGMRCCPWCGSDLVRFYRRTWQELIDEKIVDQFNLPVA
jgi:hypothetical protein